MIQIKKVRKIEHYSGIRRLCKRTLPICFLLRRRTPMYEKKVRENLRDVPPIANGGSNLRFPNTNTNRPL